MALINGSAGSLDTQFGSNTPRTVPTGFFVKTTSVYSPTTGYSWSEVRGAPGAGFAAPPLPMSGDQAYDITGNTSIPIGAICQLIVDRDQTTYGLVVSASNGPNAGWAGSGCGWVAGLRTTDCLLATLVSVSGACDCPPATYNCTSGVCVDPGDGTGTYSTLAACVALPCDPPPPPPPPSTPTPVSSCCGGVPDLSGGTVSDIDGGGCPGIWIGGTVAGDGTWFVSPASGGYYNRVRCNAGVWEGEYITPSGTVTGVYYSADCSAGGGGAVEVRITYTFTGDPCTGSTLFTYTLS